MSSSRPACERLRATHLLTRGFGLLAALLLALALPTSQAQTAAKKVLNPPATSAPPPQPAAAAPAPTPAPDQPIPLPDIADRADQLDGLLRDVAKVLAPSPEQLAANASMQVRSAEISERARQLELFLASTPNPLELQEEDRFWRTLGEQYVSYRKLLGTRAAKLQEQMQLLDAGRIQWQATLDQIRDRKGIEAVVRRVTQALHDIGESRAQTQVELNRVLNLQTQASQQDQQIAQAIAKLSEARDSFRGHFFERDSQPLWAARELRAVDDSLTAIAHRSADRSFMGAGEFLSAKTLRTIAIVLLYLATLLLALKFKRDLGLGRLPDVPPEASQILARPYSVALLVALLGTIGQTIAAPSGIVFIVYLLYTVQMVRLTPLLLHPRWLPLLYALASFSLLQGVYLLVQLSPILRRGLLAGIVFAALLAFAWLTRPSVLHEWQAADRKTRITLAGIRLGLVLLAISLVANVLGYVSLSQLVGVATLLGAFSGVLLYGLVRVLTLMLVLSLQTWAVTLGKHREGLERWGRVVLRVLGIVLWMHGVLYLFAIRESVADAIASALKYPIGFGKAQLIVGDVLTSLVVLLAGYLLANIFTFVVRELVLSKMRLSRGLPSAISTIVYYLLMVFVCVMAVSELGVELNKFTLITGALGVGVGFGLQTTVSNFVSGLILLFERPIRVGDVVEIAGVVGSVRRIGVRSSTIHTFDDAEVIVPNNELISNKVTNWTLSNSRRRVDVPVGVAYGTDPVPVLKLLVSVAEINPRVLRQPRPEAYFLGFGESALNFELRFWSTQDAWFQLKSDISVAVAKALADAGIEIPFPQRDLHLRSIDSQTRNQLYLAGPQPAEREEPLRIAGGGRTK